MPDEDHLWHTSIPLPQRFWPVLHNSVHVWVPGTIVYILLSSIMPFGDNNHTSGASTVTRMSAGYPACPTWLRISLTADSGPWSSYDYTVGPKTLVGDKHGSLFIQAESAPVHLLKRPQMCLLTLPEHQICLVHMLKPLDRLQADTHARA